MKLNRKNIEAPRIEMLPLIDIVFLLLVFFIYAMLSMAVHHGQPVNLPESSSATLEVKEFISVTIQAEGLGVNLYVDEEQVTLEGMGLELQRIKDVKQEDQEPEVQIFADKSVSYQELFRVMDCIKKAGLTRMSLQAARPASKSPAP